ncbi:VWA domain-containing protein [Candidatus Peregrinibacteria bacterium]|nr:VWA domain-containing protein [Candidatus Peregrinibacteria bacterium]
MKPVFRHLKYSLLLILPMIAIIAAQANAPYNVSVTDVDVSEFPRVRLSVSVNDENGTVTSLRAENFGIMESGKRNTGSLVVLPPAQPNTKIDLFVLLDRTGNTRNFASVIRANLKALVRYLHARGADVNIMFSAFENGSSVYETPETYLDETTAFSGIDGAEFSNEKPSRVYGFSKMDDFASQGGRAGAEKVALVINGSQFYDQDRGEATTYNVSETVNALAQKGFIVFTAGLPTRQITRMGVRPSQQGIMAQDFASLSESLPGGYVGSFAADLTQVGELLMDRSSNHYLIQYFSETIPSQASGSSPQLVIDNSMIEGFSYPASSVSTPVLHYSPEAAAAAGMPFPITVEVENNNQMVNAVDVVYWPESMGDKHLTLIHERQADTATLKKYTGLIPAQDISGDRFAFQVRVLTPYYTLGTGSSEGYSVPVEIYENGIVLKGIVNPGANPKIIWQWSGETVDMGSRYELYSGQTLLTSTTEKTFEVPVSDCNKFQQVQLKVLLKPGVNHPRAGNWSLLSAPAHAYLGPEGNITEKEGLETFFSCVQTSISMSNFVQGKTEYSPNEPLHLQKWLKYITEIAYPELAQVLLSEHYGYLYFLMQFISSEQYETYTTSQQKIPAEIVYRVIANANQSENLSTTLEKGMEELVRRLRGQVTI